MSFAYQAIDRSGHPIRDVIEAGSLDEAARLLRTRGLLVTRLSETADEPAAAREPARGRGSRRGRVRWKELVYFTQQMAMLLGSGARMISALAALETQTKNPAMLNLVHHLRRRVEDGVPLSAAMADRPEIFDGVYRSLTASGESTGRMVEAFDQIATYTRRRQEVRQKIIGALIYPCLLIVMCFGVMVGMFGFVLPRFRQLFLVLDADLPASTRIMMGLADWFDGHWLLVLFTLAAAITSAVLLFRSPLGQRWWAGVYTDIPVAGALIRRLILAKLFRIWGVLVANNVGLIDAIHLARSATRSTAFLGLMDRVEKAVTEGRRLGEALQESPLVLPTMAAAVLTGEESGRLGNSLLFVAEAMESENTQIVTSLARIIEPAILILMGAVVGLVAISLFMPMFDIATLAGGG
ncbi:MAG TPA: type II secretion system F family protein [Phycisphaerae bacterium]|nr:type II secretion system F family protein [Phycisphaerae bacterium]